MTQGSDGEVPQQTSNAGGEPADASRQVDNRSETAPNDGSSSAPQAKKQKRVAKTKMEHSVATPEMIENARASLTNLQPLPDPSKAPAPPPVPDVQSTLAAPPAPDVPAVPNALRMAAAPPMSGLQPIPQIQPLPNSQPVPDAQPMVSAQPAPGLQPMNSAQPEPQPQPVTAPPGVTPVRPRRIAKTRMYNLSGEDLDIAGSIEQSELPAPSQQAVPPNPNPPGQNPTQDTIAAAKEAPPVRQQRIAKTLMYTVRNTLESEETPLTVPPDVQLPAVQTPDAALSVEQIETNNAPALVEPRSYVTKTRIDHSILWETIAKYEAKQEKKAVEKAIEKAKEPVKEFTPVDSKRLTAACPWTWEGTDPKVRSRYCDKCQSQVYDFEGMELPEAEALIFKRESKEKATLYKRADGKFMTRDCPIQAHKQRNLMMLALVAMLLIVSVVTVMVTSPPPKPAPIATPAEPENPMGANAPPVWKPISGATAGTAGSIHYERGKPIEIVPAALPPPVPVKTNSADENGTFWQYSNQAGGQGIADPSVAQPVLPPLPKLPTEPGQTVPNPNQQANPYVKNYR
jgi:hypothetical protein